MMKFISCNFYQLQWLISHGTQLAMVHLLISIFGLLNMVANDIIFVTFSRIFCVVMEKGILLNNTLARL